MANPSPTRLSPAELRKRLLAPPTDASLPPVPEETAPQPRVLPRREHTRYGSSATQTAIDLDALAGDVPQITNPRATPLPEARLEPSQFRPQQQSQPESMQYRPQHQQPLPQMGQSHAPMHHVPASAGYEEIDHLRAQNAELHRIVEEMKPVLEEASAAEQRYAGKENELLAQLAERDNQIADLQAAVKRLEEELATIPVPKTPKTRDELEEWSDELEKESSKIAQERRRMDQDRQQLREDEESLEKQMRDMEVSMARERAMIARQETELKRLSAEIQHELEVLQRGDGTLREQLSKFERKHQEVFSQTPSASAPPPAPLPVAPPPLSKTVAVKDSGLLRRIFRGGK